MFSAILTILAGTCAVSATKHTCNNDRSGLTVTTRTGTFVGDLNDTYTDVKQFKWIPYAKVRFILDTPTENHLNTV